MFFVRYSPLFAFLLAVILPLTPFSRAIAGNAVVDQTPWQVRLLIAVVSAISARSLARRYLYGFSLSIASLLFCLFLLLLLASRFWWQIIFLLEVISLAFGVVGLANSVQMVFVFLSSTSADLLSHRDAASRTVDSIDNYKCIRMENFGARRGTPYEVSLEQARRCSLFVGIVGFCYGSCPPGSETSFTEHEYNFACRRGMPRLMFMTTAPSAVELPPDPRQIAFRNRVQQDQVVSHISSPEDLRSQLSIAIRNWEQGLRGGGG